MYLRQPMSENLPFFPLPFYPIAFTAYTYFPAAVFSRLPFYSACPFSVAFSSYSLFSLAHFPTTLQAYGADVSMDEARVLFVDKIS
jgi:hypothetical protein